VEGSIRRGDEELPLDRVNMAMRGIIIANGRAAALEGAQALRWIAALRAESDVQVPLDQVEELREALLRAPAADVTVPEELRWEAVSTEPQPMLKLSGNQDSSELDAALWFTYGDWQFDARSEQLQRVEGRQVTRRDMVREQVFRTRLLKLPIVTAWNGYKLRLAHLESVARTLTSEGWLVELQSASLRLADDLELEISSGIDWFDLNGSATFGEERVALPDILAALSRGESLLRLGDGTIAVLDGGWLESLAPLLDAGEQRSGGIRYKKAQAIVIDALLASRKVRVDAPFADLREKLTSDAPQPLQEPASFRGELREYQRAGLGWMEFLRRTGIGGCLADDMGLGKTVQVLAQLEALRLKGDSIPSLVVAPRSLLFNWAAEARRFTPELRVLEHHGPDREKSAGSFAGYDLVLTTYATMRLDVEHLAQTEFAYVILDEAQAIKNATSQVSKAVRLLRSRDRLALSGTPIENHLGELWSLFEFLAPGLLGSARAFSRTFTSKKVSPERREALARALRPLILRRTKEQVAPELPERVEQTLFCELEGKQRRQYDELRDFYRQSLLGRVRSGGLNKARMEVLEALLRLRQAACHPALVDGHGADAPSAKTELLFEELSDVLESGHRALIFSQFTSFLSIIRRELDERGIAYAYLDGKTRDREEIVRGFQSGDGPPLFLISLKAGGLGLNLTKADYVFLLDPWWNPAAEAQAIDRAHRIGRVNPVIAYRLIARDTVEEKILELQARKRELADSIITQDNSVLQKLGADDLEMLLS